MPWQAVPLEAACAGLRLAAEEGRFVPKHWIVSCEISKFGGYEITGCEMGHVAWIVAVTLCGAERAKEMMPIRDSMGDHVKTVLNHAGLTDKEIDWIEPERLVRSFDAELADAYAKRRNNRDEYIKVSLALADKCIEALKRVPVAPEKSEQASKSSQLRLQNPQSQGQKQAKLALAVRSFRRGG